MKRILGFLLILSLISCSSTRLTESWKNPEYISYDPEKILVIGVTPNFEAREDFEFKLKNELNARGINALQSTVVFKDKFQDTKQTEKEIVEEIDKLRFHGYNTILISLVKGEQKREAYSSNSPKTDYHLRRFIGYYIAYLNESLEQNYHEKYTVFNIETSVYNLNQNNEKNLVWYGNHDIIEPKNVTNTINDYVKAIVKALEKEKLISKI